MYAKDKLLVDEFACHLMVEFVKLKLANSHGYGTKLPIALAKEAYEYAEAMLNARENYLKNLPKHEYGEYKPHQ